MAGLLALLLVVVLARVIALGGDPLPDTEGGFITDWGFWAKNARMHHLWGAWTLDAYNPAYYVATGFTFTLRAVFAVVGVGIVQAALLSVCAGTALVVVLWAWVRREASPEAAMLAALLAGVSPMTIAYDRAVYPESFQLLFMLLAVAGVFATRRVSSGLGGAALALTVIVKLTGLVVAPIVALAWAVRWVSGRGSEPGREMAKAFAAYAGTAASVLAVFAVAFVLPHAAEVAAEFTDAAGGVLEPIGRGARGGRLSLFGVPPFGFRMNSFFVLQWYLILPGALLAAGRITRTLRRPVGRLELAAWTWLGFGTLYLGLMYYQPDRRFLFMLPPLAILCGVHFAGGLAIGPSAWRGRAARLAGAAGGAVAGAGAALCAVALARPWRVEAFAGALGLGWSYERTAETFIGLATLASGATAALIIRQVRAERVLRGGAVLGVVIAAVVLTRWSVAIRTRGHAMRDLAAAVSRLTASWPENVRAVSAAGTGNTLLMGTTLHGEASELPGGAAVVRLGLAVSSPDRPTPALDTGQRTMVPCATVPIWPTAGGRPLYLVRVLIVPDRLEACRAAFADVDDEEHAPIEP